MIILDKQRDLIEKIVLTFETGKQEPQYGALAIVKDGKNGTKQISYGKFQVTEQGKLRLLIREYIETGMGIYNEHFKKYINLIGVEPLSNNSDFISILKLAGEDCIMQEIQDRFFYYQYWAPALKWARIHGFELPLSMLIIYDSFIHSGGILRFLRKRFMEYPPSKDGSEIKWCTQYVNTRHQWLKYHKNPILRNTIYRTETLMAQIEKDNWSLSKQPIFVNGLSVSVD